MQSRRHFLGACASLWATAAGWSAPAHAAGRAGPHPTPRPGIDASRVVPRAALAGDPDLAEVFDMVREIPGVVDGIRCHCGCADLPESYSLLSCFEGEAMARHCEICQGQARLAHRLHRAGKSLDEIRDAIDADFG